ncbi:MAG: hypothetical protein D6725_17785 [Planctomycetota bacterium]|nr:MAG: hypothetical protein D6725_17785 [Planctomycetota bacterium]
MLLSEVEKLKRELTDKYVVVQEGIPELRRFVGRTGVVKTVNMNGRALVQFQGLEDIAWYDIDPRFLTVVEEPVEKPTEEQKKPAAAKPAGKPAATAAGASPLELARQQGPAKPEGGKKLSPLELARMQGPAKRGSAAAESASEAATAESETSSETSGQQEASAESSQQSGSGASETPAAGGKQLTGPDGRTLSPLELARLQGPFKGDK